MKNSDLSEEDYSFSCLRPAAAPATAGNSRYMVLWISVEFSQHFMTVSFVST